MPDSSSPHGSRKTRPGGRTAAVHRAVLEAALAELAERGYGGLTFDGVAARAGVHRSTIYRRWSSKEELAGDALLSQAVVAVPMPDTGSAMGDLEQLVVSVAGNIGSAAGEGLLRALVSDAARAPGLVQAASVFWERRFSLAGDVVRRGIARGDLPGDIDVDLFIEALVAPLFFRLLVRGQPATTTTAADLATRIVRAAGKGAFTTGHED